MDIVHLIETKIIQSSQDQSSHTYAEIEQTISLDHSEGMDDVISNFTEYDDSLHYYYNYFTTVQQKLYWPLQVFQRFRRTWTAPGRVGELRSLKENLGLWWHLLRISPVMCLPSMIPRKRGC